MKLSQAFDLISASEGEKTASAPPATAVVPLTRDIAADGLRQALKEATADTETPTKTAAQVAPIDELTKLAADVVTTEHESMVKEAQLYGASVCDGFMARLAQYNEAASRLAPDVPTKVAGAVDTFEKFAAENPELVQDAYTLGYTQAKQKLAEWNQAAYEHGHDSTVRWIHKTATDNFVTGFADALRLIEASR